MPKEPRVHGLLRPPTYNCKDRWGLWIQPTGLVYSGGDFTLEVIDGETVTVEWNETADSLKEKLLPLLGPEELVCQGGPLDTREIVLNHVDLNNLQIVANNLVSGRPYLSFNYWSAII